MKINKNNLQEALEIVKPGLANKEDIDQSTSFAFLGGRVVTYNDRISISHPVEGLNIEGAIRADELYKILSKVKISKEEEDKPNMEMIIEDNQIIFSKGKMKTGLTVQAEILLPLDDENLVKKGDWFDLPEDFVKFIKFCAPSCSRDMSRAVLTAIHINESGFIEASDNYRITRCELLQEFPVETFLLPADAAIVMVRVNPISIAKSQGWIHFQNEYGTILSCRIMEDAFPNTTGFLNMEGQKLTFPPSITEVLERASIFSKRDHLLDEHVTITIESNKIKVESKSDTGWFSEELNMRYSGDPVYFMISPYLLTGILKETLTFIVSATKLKFEGERWTYLSALKIKG